MKKNIFAPSFKIERKTKALNGALWGFVGLISMFSINLFVFVLHLLLCSLLALESTFILEHISVFIVPTLFFAFMFGIGLFKFSNKLLYSYKFEENQIIKGRIIDSNKVSSEDLALQTAAVAYMAQNIGKGSKVNRAHSLLMLNDMINLITLNTNQEFVEQFFDTNLYSKKIYNNPKKIKETKYAIIYTCEEKKKLKIPKLFEGITTIEAETKEQSISSRILKRSFLFLGIASLFSLVDLMIGIKNNEQFRTNIKNTCSNIQTNLNGYGYQLKNNCNFEKEISNKKTSKIRYHLDKNGAIEKVEMDIFYDKTTFNETELRIIISSLNLEITEQELKSFINQAKQSVEGTYTNGKIKTKKDTIFLSLSEGFIHIHNQY